MTPPDAVARGSLIREANAGPTDRTARMQPGRPPVRRFSVLFAAGPVGEGRFGA
jgi:hypothetical protein